MEHENSARPDGKLLTQAASRMACGAIILGLLLFGSAGTLDYWQAWLLMGALFIPMLIAGCVLLFRNPELLKKRLSAKEEQPEQRAVVLSSALMFTAAFIAAGLCRRFQWLLLSAPVSWAAALVFLLGYALYAEVLRENAYLSRTVEIQEEQKLIDTGLYGLVRHPMYLSTLLLFLSMPLILASPLSFAVMLLYIPLIAARIRNEEQVLEEGLPGYRDYKTRVRYKVIPGVW